MKYAPKAKNISAMTAYSYHKLENKLSSRFKSNDPGNDTYRFKHNQAKPSSSNKMLSNNSDQNLIAQITIKKMTKINGVYFELDP